MYGALDISTSGMIAQRTRMTAIAANIANKNSVYPDGTPYRARHVMFAAGDPASRTAAGRGWGVHVAQIQIDQSPFNPRWAPGDPPAIKEGHKAGYGDDANGNPA